MQSAEAMNGLVFFKVLAHAAPEGIEFSNNTRFGAQKKHCLSCFQLQLFKPKPGVVCRLVFIALVKWRMWLNTNDLATHCAGLLIPKWACM